MSKDHKSCLILNADYSPIGIINWQKAMVWSFRYISFKHSQIEILEYHYDDYINTSNGKQLIPAVIKTTRYYKLNNSYVNFSRKNLFLRDNYTCQYCGDIFSINQLTYDHVIPKSQWSKNESPTCWTNIVTACRKCNTRKGNKTPAQANMPLMMDPYIPKKSPKYLPIHEQLTTISIPEPWLLYIK